jgi:hypothetical protein
VLARLQTIEGLSHAGVDYGGKHMRVAVEGPGALAAATAALRELGYEPEVVTAAGPVSSKWYDVDSVYELSAVEAKVIAHRVVGTFVRKTAVASDVEARLERAVSAALHRCFTDRDASPDARPAQFQSDCLRNASEAARGVLDAVDLGSFVDTLEADLNEDHTHDAGL